MAWLVRENGCGEKIIKSKCVYWTFNQCVERCKWLTMSISIIWFIVNTRCFCNRRCCCCRCRRWFFFASNACQNNFKWLNIAWTNQLNTITCMRVKIVTVHKSALECVRCACVGRVGGCVSEKLYGFWGSTRGLEIKNSRNSKKIKISSPFKCSINVMCTTWIFGSKIGHFGQLTDPQAPGVW